MRALCLLTISFLAVSGCTRLNDTLTPNQEMTHLLKRTAEELFFIPENMYANQVRITYFDSLMNATPSLQASYKLKKGVELLHAGETEESIKILLDLYEQKKSSRFVAGMDGNEEGQIEYWLALAYMRKGEQDNCIHHHAAASCIIPVTQAGQHGMPEGSRAAIQLYASILSQDNNDLTARWLYNLAHMTVGTYPDSVSSKWLIPPEAFSSVHKLKPFHDIAAQVGLGINTLSGGSVVDDFNNDGYLDVMVSEWHPNGQLRYFENNLDGTFSEKTEEAQLKGLTGGINILQADYNNDGWLDVFVPRGGWLYESGKFPNSLLRNNGDGTFTDVTKDLGLLSFHPTQTAVWTDANSDGWLDLYIGNESSGPEDAHPCELYLNHEGKYFDELAAEAGVALVYDSLEHKDWYVKGVTAGDYNGDGREDLYISLFHPHHSNILFRNEGVNEKGQLTFLNVTQKAGIAESHSSFPVWFWDYNQDGWEDIFVAGYERSSFFGSISQDIAAEMLGLPHTATTARLYQNKGDGTFEDISSQVGLDKILYAMGANYGDLDNDGWQDMYLSTGEVNLNSVIPNRMFRNNDGQEFQEVTYEGGFGHIQKGHGVSFADIDNDGDQDIHVVMGGAYEGDTFFNSLFENPYQDTNHWISFQLEGTTTNRSAIGTKVALELEEGDSIRTLYRTVSSGGSFGCSPLRLEIGLGEAERVKKLQINWMGSATPQVFHDIEVNQFYYIQEGKDSIQIRNLSAISLSSS
ncbi:MAG: CRTAC1 family protein [Bacteroidota bacterium]